MWKFLARLFRAAFASELAQPCNTTIIVPPDYPTVCVLQKGHPGKCYAPGPRTPRTVQRDEL